MVRVYPKIEFIYSEEFDTVPEKIILGPLPPYPPQRKAKPAPGLPAYLAALYNKPLMGRTQECHIFRKYNYLRWKLAKFHMRMKLVSCFKMAQEIIELRNFIVSSNLRLAVHMAKMYPSVDIHDGISIGNVGLMRAAERFDYMQGNKFSTYAANAIKMQFRNEWRARNRHEAHFVNDPEPSMQAAFEIHDIDFKINRQASRELIESLLSLLDEKKQFVLRNRYGFGTEAKTLKEVGEMMDLTKERVRQIQFRALEEIESYARLKSVTKSLEEGIGGSGEVRGCMVGRGSVERWEV